MTVGLFGLRALGCSDRSHARRFLTSDHGADLVSELLYGDAIPRARVRGLLRRRLACARCGGSLPAGGAAPGTLRARIWVQPAPPFTLTLDGPVATCGRCRLRQLLPEPELEARLERAVHAALSGARLA